eukprot:TRINITY_DN1370_c0_g1_i1.p1 TRINITY_DN1370_c0_g1~~TRINITY_DN1370_c0_g1_i1.p1  ORF type:complete len:310 (-),score=39.12 TRINITY_DN1370_c0_g1_i1:129-1058(-)
MELDLSLDDIIQSKRQRGGNNRVQRGGRKNDSQRNDSRRTNRRVERPTRDRPGVNKNSSVPFETRSSNRRDRELGEQRETRVERVPKGNPEGVWKHDLYQDSNNSDRARLVKRLVGDLSGGQNDVVDPSVTKLKISNLHYNVTEDELKTLFNGIGRVTVARIFFDASGRSLGKALVVFGSARDAQQAIRQFNGVKMYDQPIIVSASSNADATDATEADPYDQRGSSSYSRIRSRGRGFGARGRGREAGSVGARIALSLRGRAHTRGSGLQNSRKASTSRRFSSGNRQQPSREELDQELEDYNKIPAQTI